MLTSLFSSMAEYAKKNTKTAVAGLLFIVAVGYFGYTHFFSNTGSKITYTLEKVTRGTLTTYVSSSGQVIVKNQVDLKPQAGGTVVRVPVTVGQYVKKGQLLLALDARSALSGLTQAKANLASAKVTYQKVLDGATTADVLALQSSLDTSKVSLSSTKQNAIQKLSDTYLQTSDIVINKTNQFFANPNTVSPTFNIQGYPLNNQNLQSSIEQERAEINAILPTWKQGLNIISLQEGIDNGLTGSLANLNKVATYLDNIALALNSSSANDSTMSGYRSTVSSARQTISSLISGIISSQQSLVSANSQVAQNQAQLDLKKAPPTEGDLTIAKAQLTNAEANLENAQTSYENTVLVAPFDAVVGAVAVKVGDQASQGTTAFTLITQNQMADLSLNEVDATKIALGQKATLTFDAVPDLTLAGTVAEQSPLGTVTQGVVTYNVKIAFDTQDKRVKPGMSVTANIITAVKGDVLLVPSEAVKTDRGNTYISIPAAGFSSSSSTVVTELLQVPAQKSVVAGISNDTATEIASGIQEGDWIIVKTSTQSGTKTATTQQSAISILGGRAGAGGAGTRALGR